MIRTSPANGGYLVAVGGSAGSVRTILNILKRLRNGESSALFVIYHRVGPQNAPLHAFLSKGAEIQIASVRQPVPLRANTVYHPYASNDLELADGWVHAFASEVRPRPNIDRLFQSLAAHSPLPVVAVLLSGLGRDGVNGLEAIRARGGITIAQDPLEAPYPSMPREALETGAARYALDARSIEGLVVRMVGGGGLPPGLAT